MIHCNAVRRDWRCLDRGCSTALTLTESEEPHDGPLCSQSMTDRHLPTAVSAPRGRDQWQWRRGNVGESGIGGVGGR